MIHSSWFLFSPALGNGRFHFNAKFKCEISKNWKDVLGVNFLPTFWKDTTGVHFFPKLLEATKGLVSSPNFWWVKLEFYLPYNLTDTTMKAYIFPKIW